MGSNKYEIHVMTMVDPVTGWLEQQQLYGSPTAYIIKSMASLLP
jgi:hypothetical protein